MELLHRRATRITLTGNQAPPGDEDLREALLAFDEIYRSLCAALYNYVPRSGHPGGSISSGRIVSLLLFHGMDYDLEDPDREDADIISYAAGHKALGLYALWALRDEIARVGAPSLLPKRREHRLRLEDLLGFRRNPVTATPLFKKFGAKPLDGHPTPATPFVRLATGASGVGDATSLGLAFAARDYFGENAPRVHIIEGEGGMTPGRVSEALAAAGTASLSNAILHVDWNQASIDSDRVCRQGNQPGDYVQWTPAELCLLHDWNVVEVEDGTDFGQLLAAEDQARAFRNGQPTAIVYKTTKGWRYGIEGRKSHGAGHSLCSEAFLEAVAPLRSEGAGSFPTCREGQHRCDSDPSGEVMEECFYQALMVVRRTIEERTDMMTVLARALEEARHRLDARGRRPREGAPSLALVFSAADSSDVPSELCLEPGKSTTLRAQLGKCLGYLNRNSNGALIGAAADLLGSTSINLLGEGFPDGYYNALTNPGSRLLAAGGICEDAMCGILAGLSSFGKQIGVGSSYGAFIAPLGHIAARLHCIGNQARRAIADEPYRTFLLVCAHAGLKTGEDGPTHADPQALQLLQENFPVGTLLTLTPWDPQEIWPLLAAALRRRPAVIAPFVTRPSEPILDRQALRLAPAAEAAHGIYLLRDGGEKPDCRLVLQGSAVAYAFVQDALPLCDSEGLRVTAHYVASVELFDLLNEDERKRILPESVSCEAMGITDFTLPTIHRFVTSERGRKATLHPYRLGHYLGSGPGHRVLEEAGLDGKSQFEAIRRYARES